jgi:cytidine deaminase
MMISNDQLRDMARAARAASERAYCPYSRFPVGAAVLTSAGEVFTGCNIENAAYGSTMCAERVAVFQAIAKGQREVKAVVIYTPTPRPSASCGACRQVINEFGPGAEVVCVCDGPDVLRARLNEFLPEAFGPQNMAEKQAR